ncbi:vWA domain-containing protein [Cylindrospermopsis raciborskii]|uniref:vWA domain-containing protein n=1 Tax=Cylindrospermopsis raciborskii TaxID=77022 RepID=UPI001BA691B4|nr:VWA domain-containing protein [Cylindrospermopsis raciborskii]
MLNLINRLKNNKTLLFAIYGSAGCLTAAILLGEPFLALTKIRNKPTTNPQAIVLLIDTSSSMSDGKLTEVKTAASQFVQRRNLEVDQIAVVNFGSAVATPAPLTNDINILNNAINQLLENGSTPMGEGINTAQDQLQATTLNKNIILFTDGIPDDPNFAYNSALSVRNAGIKLIAVATGGADTNYLTQITGDRSLVFYANSGQFDQAFSQAEAVIYKQLIESNTGENYGFTYSIFRTGGWTAFLSMGICLALIMGQNRYMRLPLLTAKKGIITIIGSLVAGTIAGASGQFLFVVLSVNTTFSGILGLEVITKIGGWVIVGAVVGAGTKFFVPNLNLKNALLGGTVGGGIGSGGFLITSSILGDIMGRLSGVSILGFFIGLMIAWIEQKQLNSEPYLLVHWTPTEQTRYLLGTRPISIGTSVNVEIPLSATDGFAPLTARIFKEGSDIIMEFDQEYARMKKMRVTTQSLKVGDVRKLGKITLEVKDKT